MSGKRNVLPPPSQFMWHFFTSPESISLNFEANWTISTQYFKSNILDIQKLYDKYYKLRFTILLFWFSIELYLFFFFLEKGNGGSTINFIIICICMWVNRSGILYYVSFLACHATILLHYLYSQMQLLKWCALLELHIFDLRGYFVTLFYLLLLMDEIVSGWIWEQDG